MIDEQLMIFEILHQIFISSFFLTNITIDLAINTPAMNTYNHTYIESNKGKLIYTLTFDE